MTDANTIEKLRGQLEAANLERELEEARYAVRSMQTVNTLVSEQQQVPPPPLVDPYDDYDDPDFRLPSGRGNFPYSTVEDRSDGKFIPLYESELDLSRMRAQCNKVAFLDVIGVGALESLRDYTIGSGLRYLASPLDETSIPSGLVEAVQELIDHICYVNEWKGGLELEYHDRGRRDGEVISVLTWQNGDVYWSEEEPEFLTEPQNASTLEPYVPEAQEFETSWSFGVLTPKSRPQDPVGYHFARNAEGTDWDYIPAERVSHYKRNVYRRAKRGVSDYWPVKERFESNSKLTRNVGEGGALQAAIAWIREMPPGSSISGAQGRVVQEATYKRQVRNVGGTADRYVKRFAPGTIVTTTGGKYHPGPMAMDGNKGFILVSQHLMRAIGVRWSLPEYLVSGDGSNGNYSTTSIQADSFVRARLSDQWSFGMGDVHRIWKSLRMYFVRGRLDSYGLSWDEIKQRVQILPKGEDPSTKDPLGKREALKIETEAGWTSDETASRELGRDYDEEVAKGAERHANPNVASVMGDDKGGRPPERESRKFLDSLNQLYERYGEVWT